jgi:hypothetical protein
MRGEELRNLIRQQPFNPIRLHLTDGTTYDIRHPEMAFITKSTVEIGQEEKEGSGVADEVMYVTLIHIVRAEYMNGHAERTPPRKAP